MRRLLLVPPALVTTTGGCWIAPDAGSAFDDVAAGEDQPRHAGPPAPGPCRQVRVRRSFHPHHGKRRLAHRGRRVTERHAVPRWCGISRTNVARLREFPAYVGQEIAVMPCGVAPVPAHLAPKSTAGRCVAAVPGGTQAGTDWVSAFALESRPLYALEALTLHEAVPGHHFRYALAREPEEVPPFRRFAEMNAFSEGW